MNENKLAQTLSYTFKNSALLKTALTHRSYHENNNERLEFLGDAVVNFIIAEALYLRHPTAPEGELSRWRATLINRETLAVLAQRFKLGNYLYLGPGELKSGGNKRLSILSCAMEAIIGAIYLDGGFATVYNCVLRWYEAYLCSLTAAENHKDPKTRLQEYLQSVRLALPAYTVETTEGDAHQQIFTVSCQVAGLDHKAYGKGTSRRRAEQEAAVTMLGILNHDSN